MPASPFRLGRSFTGLGLFATKPIKRRAYIATYRGRRIPNEEADRREARGARYMFKLNRHWTIDGSPRWNVARYINHSCRPNAEPITRKGRIVIIALRRIEPGEEITYHYGTEYLEYFRQNGGCKCVTCRKRAATRRKKLKEARRGQRQKSTRARRPRKRK
jgi:SET domain-containing protein